MAKKENLAQKSLEDLKVLLRELRGKLLSTKLDFSRGKVKNTTELTLMRKQIAQVLTAMKEKEVTK